MVNLELRPELERRVREHLATGADANELMEIAMDALRERKEIGEQIEAAWKQAEAGEFVQSSPESVIRRAQQN